MTLQLDVLKISQNGPLTLEHRVQNSQNHSCTQYNLYYV